MGLHLRDETVEALHRDDERVPGVGGDDVPPTRDRTHNFGTDDRTPVRPTTGRPSPPADSTDAEDDADDEDDEGDPEGDLVKLIDADDDEESGWGFTPTELEVLSDHGLVPKRLANGDVVVLDSDTGNQVAPAHVAAILAAVAEEARREEKLLGALHRALGAQSPYRPWM